jgi:UDP-N-acetylglucosamine:LPS N-acetylglucosamine transferase
MNVLILTGKLGLGHYSAASALAQEIQISPDIHVYIEDIFNHCLKKNSKALYGSISFIVKRGRHIYNMVYKHTEKTNKNTKLRFSRHFIHSLEQMIQDTEADIVISTLTFCSKVASMYKRETQHKLPLITCITDFTSHSGSIRKQIFISRLHQS